MPRFQVNGLPPNKSVKGSMWANEEQAHRLIALREAALTKPVPRVFAGPVRLTLKVHVGIPDWDTLDTDARRKALKECGDLDNFVAGVCDGLMKAHPNTLKVPRPKGHPLLSFPEHVRPSKPIAFKDDSQIMKIDAERIVSSGDHRWYEVVLEEE